MLLCIGSYLLCKMMNLQVITMGGFLTEVKATGGGVLGIGEVLEAPHRDGVGTEALMTSLAIHMGEGGEVGEVVEVMDPVTAGLEWEEEAVGMTG